MKTLEDFLSRYRLVETNNGDRSFLEEDVVDAIEQAVNEALSMASERGKVNIWRSYPKEHNLDVTSLSTYHNFGKDVMTISKQSILSLAPEVIKNLK